MSDMNVIVLFGRLTRDPQLSYTPSGTAVVDTALASNRVWTGKDGQKHEKVLFIDLRCFGRMAENINQYFKRGSPILISGSLEFEQWTAKDGTKRSRHRVVVTGFQFLPNGNQGQQQANGGRQQPPQQQAPQGQQQAPPPHGQRQSGWDDDFGPPPTDDEIPF